MLNKRIASIVVAGMVIFSMVGCSNTSNTVETSEGTVIELSLADKIEEYNEYDNLAIVKVRDNTLFGNAEKDIRANFINVYDIIMSLPENIDELQYWSVTDNNGTDTKVFSCTIKGEALKVIRINGSMFYTDIASMSSKCSELWIHPQFADYEEIVWPVVEQQVEVEDKDLTTKERMAKEKEQQVSNDTNTNSDVEERDNYTPEDKAYEEGYKQGQALREQLEKDGVYDKFVEEYENHTDGDGGQLAPEDEIQHDMQVIQESIDKAYEAPQQNIETPAVEQPTVPEE
ncbi:MAG: hypothetical protein ACI3T9_04520 [Romboutsia timonensis]